MIIIRWLPQLSSITPSYNFPRRSGGFYPWKSFLLAGINIFPISTSTLPFMSHWLRVEPGGVSFPEHMLPQTYTQLACCSQNTRVKQLLRDQASDISLTQDLWIYPAPKLVPGTVLMLKEEKKKEDLDTICTISLYCLKTLSKVRFLAISHPEWLLASMTSSQFIAHMYSCCKHSLNSLGYSNMILLKRQGPGPHRVSISVP